MNLDIFLFCLSFYHIPQNSEKNTYNAVIVPDYNTFIILYNYSNIGVEKFF